MNPKDAGRGWRLALAAAAALLGLAQAWASRHQMQPDGIAYLDMGEAYLRGDWNTALNTCFSPLYSWLLGLAMRILRPPAFWEFPTVHLVNFFIYLAAMGAFHFFWSELGRSKEAKSGTLPRWVWWTTGYGVFAWTSLNLIALNLNNPDLCVSALIYAAAGLLVRIGKGDAGWALFAVFGAVLGCAYLAKSYMLGQAALFLAVAALGAGQARRAVPRAAIAGLVFLLVAGPFVAALSARKGRFTAGDAGRLNYIWHVMRYGEHLGRRVHDSPAVYEFQSPAAATYPIFYDPSDWHRDWSIRFNWRRQFQALGANLKVYYDALYYMDSLFLGCGVLALAGQGWRRGFREIARQWPLLIPAAAAFGMFGLIHVETRYVGAYVVLTAGAILSAAKWPEAAEAGKWATYVCAAMLALMGGRLAASSAGYVWSAARDLARGVDAAAPEPWQAAEALKALGLRPRDRVGYVPRPNSVFPPDHEWARLARVQIAAQIPVEEAAAFWRAAPAAQGAALRAMAGAGIRAVVADARELHELEAGWRRLGGSHYYVRFLPVGGASFP